MRTMDADVVVIGGGATGAGVVRDVAMRGYRAVLLDKADLGQGTTGRYHGLLHSGGRYVVSDPGSATECAEENEIVTRIHADAVEKTGGLFVVTPEDDLEFSDQWAAWLKCERDRFYTEHEAMFETRGAPKKVEPYEEYDFA